MTVRVAGKQKRWVCALAPSDLSQDWFKQKCAYGGGPALSKHLPEASLGKPHKTVLPFSIGFIAKSESEPPVLLSVQC